MQQLVLWGGTLPRLAGHRLLPRGCLRPTRRRDVAVPRLEPHAGHRPPVRQGAVRRAGVRVRRSHRSARRRRSDGRAHPICVVADAVNPMPTYGIDEQFQAAYSRLNDTPTYDPSGVRPGNPDPARPDQLAWPPDPAMTHVRVDPDGNPMTRVDGTPWNVMPGSYPGVDDRVVVNGPVQRPHGGSWRVRIRTIRWRWTGGAPTARSVRGCSRAAASSVRSSWTARPSTSTPTAASPSTACGSRSGFGIDADHPGVVPRDPADALPRGGALHHVPPMGTVESRPRSSGGESTVIRRHSGSSGGRPASHVLITRAR